VLDLQPGVHLHEVEAPVLLGDEFHRARADIVDRLRRSDRGLRHFSGIKSWSRCFLQHFLVAALHRAVALEEVHHVAVRVAEHLHLDVARRSR